MRKESKKVYSNVAGAKKLVSVVEVNLFQTLDEVIAHAKQSEKAAANLILNLNRMITTDAMNTARADATREVKPETVIGRAIKDDPKLLAKMVELMKANGITMPTIPEVAVGATVGKKEVK